MIYLIIISGITGIMDPKVFLFKQRKNLKVGRQPVEFLKPVELNPDSILMLFQPELSVNNPATKTMEREMKLRIVVFNSGEQVANFYVGVELLKDFAVQRLLWGLSRLNLTAREFPVVLEIAIATLGGEQTPFLNNNCCNYLNRFHTLNGLITQRMLISTTNLLNEN